MKLTLKDADTDDEESYVHVDDGARTIYITGKIHGKVVHQAIIALERLDAEEATIRIVLNSEGGNEQDGYAIYDAIMMCKSTVVIDGYGDVCSIAAAIFQAADLRRLAPHTDFMIHNGEIDGEEKMKQTAVLDMADQIKKDSQKYYDILSGASQQPQEIIENWCRGDTYFTAKEAVEAGFADEVIKPVKKRSVPRKKRSKKP